jgi:competence CoiA-like predicted nuclease
MKFGWALNNKEELLHISEASSGDNGYVCPICKAPVIARKGDERGHHFAHKEKTASHESPLHYAAKSIIADLIEEGRFEHTRKIQFKAIDEKTGIEVEIKDDITERLFTSARPLIEARFSNAIAPDLTANPDRYRSIAIEVFVTNKKQASDIQKFKAAELSVLEVDLSKLSFDASIEQITTAVKDKENHEWLFLCEKVFSVKTIWIQDEAERIKNANEFKVYTLADEISEGLITKRLTSKVTLKLTHVVKEFSEVKRGLWRAVVFVNEKTLIPVYFVDRSLCNDNLDNDGKPFFMREFNLWDEEDYWLDTKDWRRKAILKYGK